MSMIAERYTEFSTAVQERLAWYKAQGALDTNTKAYMLWFDETRHNDLSLIPRDGLVISTTVVTLEFVNLYSYGKPNDLPLAIGGNMAESVAYWLVVLHHAMQYACLSAQNVPLVELLNWEHLPVLGHFRATQLVKTSREVSEVNVVTSVNSSIYPSPNGVPQEQVIELPAYTMRYNPQHHLYTTAMHTTSKNIAAILGRKSSALRLIAHVVNLHEKRQAHIEQVEL